MLVAASVGVLGNTREVPLKLDGACDDKRGVYAGRSKRADTREDEHGFTLPELLTAIAILGIRMAIAVIIFLALLERWRLLPDQADRSVRHRRPETGGLRTGQQPPPDPGNAGGAQGPDTVMVGRMSKDEAGVALGLAVIMVVVIGVMGAGLLTLVVTDLHATIEANRGERAFEMAEAGVEVAKARLAEDPDLAAWSSGELRVEGVEGIVAVTIERRDAGNPYFAATSTGQYGSARRKIEATFSLVDGEPRLLSWRELDE
jgi:prepilin-type N-terminal cleavage/methylation domain-containing protein